MSIEQHTDPMGAPEPAPVETGAAFAHLLHGLTRAVLGLPDEPAAPEAAPPAEVEPTDPFSDRRPTNVLSELGFLDD